MQQTPDPAAETPRTTLPATEATGTAPEAQSEPTPMYASTASGPTDIPAATPIDTTFLTRVRHSFWD